ncbi:piwi-like protein Siwi [Aphis gossypii]|uniref:piwi-like protein Siwi n=1 Tax=Aphis gossypii TaxID=80765 RepID=UPI002159023E|nr:piwi-like protein Siwi [Aphis gossypii]XP_050056927.1 piwi-like protein Siwi [Aphis gossypii]XP_050056928.1 piwi-like protein Siwi [Aphis gossypii]
MDNPWRARGRARGPRPPPPRQPQQFRGPQTLPPRFGNMPPLVAPQQQFRGPQPLPPQIKNLPPQVVSQQEIRPSEVEAVGQITNRNNNLATGHASMPIGRGAVRGRQPIENGYFRLERPVSSKSDNGKQGKGGQSIELISNYFPITTYTDWSLYQYRVDFKPEQDRINIKRGLLSAHKEFLGAYIFDGTMMFSRKKLESDTIELTSKRNTDDQIIIITLKLTSVIEKGDYASIQVFNILLRKCLANLELTQVGRNYYDSVAKIGIPNHRLQLWPGYETTIGMFDCGLLLRAEISTKVMREDTVLDFLIECSNNRNSNPNWMMAFKMGVIGSIVLTRYNNQTYRIDDVDEESCTNSTFLKKDGSSISYIDYYKNRYGINISNQKQPMLISKKKKSFRIEGEETELVYLVPELCSMTGLTIRMSENKTLMRDLAQYTRVDPTGRIVKYNNFIKRVHTTPESADTLAQWNLTLSNKLITVNARVLSEENLSGADSHKYPSGKNANWTSNLRNTAMFRRAIILFWVLVTPRQHSSDVGKFIDTLLMVANGLGFTLPRPRIVELPNSNMRTYSVELDNIVNTLNPPFILCVTASARNDLYSMIKRKLCVSRAVPSQVVLLRNIQNNDKSVCTKIAIQINCKVGGAPWKVSIPELGMMIVGFDVFHDKQNKNKSYGAFIATMEDSHTKYFSCVEKHESGQEISTYFSTSISKALIKYREKNHKLPNTIVIYRDGVGDGQLTYVHKTEVEMVKKTCREFYGEKKVGLAFIIVKKRISTRFFCKTTVGKNENYQNPPAGTVIDNSVTDPTMYDFYLVPQHVTRGTVTPTHYNVILDTLNETASQPITPAIIQKLTYKLTHMYYNWSGTVRVPSVCQLAHKLAFLAGQSLQSNPNPGLEDYLHFL